MANTITSPNMNLPVPVATVDPGPDYAFNLVLCLNSIDSHNHSSGQGVPIPPGGLNINSDLTFQQNNATSLRSVRFFPQSSPLALAADVGCLYESGVDLYYNDGSGNQVRITQSGGVAGSPGSIASLASPASATYVSGTATFVWQSAANTPANLDAASIILRNLSASSKGLTLNPPAAMGADFSLTLPSIPIAQSFITLDASGNFGTPVAYPLPTAGIANGAVTRAKLAAVGQQVSSSSGLYTTTSTSFVTVTNLSITLTTTGRPVIVFLQSDGSGNASYMGPSLTGQIQFLRITRNGSEIARIRVSSSAQIIAAFPFMQLDTPAAASNVYEVQTLLVGSGNVSCAYFQLVAYEL